MHKRVINYLFLACVISIVLLTQSCNHQETVIGVATIEYNNIFVDVSDNYYLIPNLEFTFRENSILINGTALYGFSKNDTIFQFLIDPEISKIRRGENELHIEFRDLISGDSCDISFGMISYQSEVFINICSDNGTNYPIIRFWDAKRLEPEGITAEPNNKVIPLIWSYIEKYNWKDNISDTFDILDIADRIEEEELFNGEKRYFYEIGNKWGILDENKMKLAHLMYAGWLIKGNLILVTKTDDNGNLRWGVLDQDGKTLLKCIYDGILDYFINSDKNRMYLVGNMNKNGINVEGAIDKFGNIIFSPVYNSIDYFYDEYNDGNELRECFYVRDAHDRAYYSNMYIDNNGKLSFYDKPKKTFIGKLKYSKYDDYSNECSNLRIYDDYLVCNLTIYHQTFQGEDYSEYSDRCGSIIRMQNNYSYYQTIISEDGTLFNEYRLTEISYEDDLKCIFTYR